jgi:hypothetical protein
MEMGARIHMSPGSYWLLCIHWDVTSVVAAVDACALEYRPRRGDVTAQPARKDL